MTWKFRAGEHGGARAACGGLILFAWVLASGCTANKKPSRVEQTLANMAKDAVIPIQAEDLGNPFDPADAATVTEGQQIYGQACALCHGASGRADSDLGQSMYPPAMDLTSPHAASWTDAELFWIIQNGIRFTGMPAWKSQISDPDTWKLILFLRTLPASAAKTLEKAAAPLAEAKGDPAAYGRLLYRQEGCFMCHQLDGDGGTLGPDLSVEGTRKRVDDWLIGHFKNPPAYTKGSIMPSYKNLTQEQLQALVSFLQSQKTAVPGSPAGAARPKTAARK